MNKTRSELTRQRWRDPAIAARMMAGALAAAKASAESGRPSWWKLHKFEQECGIPPELSQKWDETFKRHFG